MLPIMLLKPETVERYNSLLQLKNILCRQKSQGDIEETLNKYISPKSDRDEVRLPNVDDMIETKFNRIFEKGVNSDLMGNCLRWAAFKIIPSSGGNQRARE